jgi:hypothetical protein
MVTEALDRVLFVSIVSGWPSERITRYVDLLQVDNAHSPVPDVIARTFQSIDTKAAGLLTHTSMMIAALGLFAPAIAESRWEQIVILSEILCYLLIAIGCLRCISMLNEHYIDRGGLVRTIADDVIRNELIVRRELFIYCNRFCFYLTGLILVSLPVIYFISPAGSKFQI